MNQAEAWAITEQDYWHRGYYYDMDTPVSVTWGDTGLEDTDNIVFEFLHGSNRVYGTTKEVITHMLLKDMRSRTGTKLPQADYYEEVE